MIGMTRDGYSVNEIIQLQTSISGLASFRLGILGEYRFVGATSTKFKHEVARC